MLLHGGFKDYSACKPTIYVGCISIKFLHIFLWIGFISYALHMLIFQVEISFPAFVANSFINMHPLYLLHL